MIILNALLIETHECLKFYEWKQLADSKLAALTWWKGIFSIDKREWSTWSRVAVIRKDNFFNFSTRVSSCSIDSSLVMLSSRWARRIIGNTRYTEVIFSRKITLHIQSGLLHTTWRNAGRVPCRAVINDSLSFFLNFNPTNKLVKWK